MNKIKLVKDCAKDGLSYHGQWSIWGPRFLGLSSCVISDNVG